MPFVLLEYLFSCLHAWMTPSGGRVGCLFVWFVKNFQSLLREKYGNYEWQCPPSFVVSGSCGQRLGSIPGALLTSLTLNTLNLNSSTMNESCWQQCMNYAPTSNGGECVAATFTSDECVTFVGEALVSTKSTTLTLGNTMLKDCFDSKCFFRFCMFVCVWVSESEILPYTEK